MDRKIIDEVLAEMDAMSAEEFRAEMEKAKDGEFTHLLMEGGFFKSERESSFAGNEANGDPPPLNKSGERAKPPPTPDE